jgi:hypothetical protein
MFEGNTDHRETGLIELDESNAAADPNIIGLHLRDGLDEPLPALELVLTYPDRTVVEVRVDDTGYAQIPRQTETPLEIPSEDSSNAFAPSTSSEVSVAVKKADGNLDVVCTIDLARCQQDVILRSPKVNIQFQNQPHNGPNPTNFATGAQPTTKPPTQASVKPPVKPASAPASTPAAKPAQTPAPLPPLPWYKALLHQTHHWIEKHLGRPLTPAEINTGRTPVLVETRNKNNNPVVIAIGPECPNKDNLCLGKNNIFRKAILDAAKRCKLDPQALGALINAEAAQLTKYVPVLDANGQPKLGKNKQVQKRIEYLGWNPNSFNAGSNAAGLTQFIVGTWLGYALQGNSHLHQQCVARGWIRTIENKRGQKHHEFVLSTGLSVPRPEQQQYVSDANVKDCLQLRFDPTCSIEAAADLGYDNLRVLENSHFDLSKTTSSDKAKLMYLLHHEGPSNGVLFIKNKLASMSKGKFASSLERLKSIFVLQIGAKLADKYLNEADNNVELAYRRWLCKYIDDKVVYGDYCCTKPEKKPHETTEVLALIGGIHVA